MHQATNGGGGGGAKKNVEKAADACKTIFDVTHARHRSQSMFCDTYIPIYVARGSPHRDRDKVASISRTASATNDIIQLGFAAAAAAQFR